MSPHLAGLEVLSPQNSASASQHTIQKKKKNFREGMMDFQMEIVMTMGRLRGPHNIKINLHLTVNN